MAYRPIEDHGIIGDMHTAALVANDGTIDWCCLPRFDAPSIFAQILDDRRGGYFQVCSCEDGVSRQMYLPQSNVLITRFLAPGGVAQVVDFMPVATPDGGTSPGHVPTIVRQVSCVRGSVRVRAECFPAFNYAREAHTVARGQGRVCFESAGGQHLELYLPEAPYSVRDGGIEQEFTLREGEQASYLLRLLPGLCSDAQPPDVGAVEPLLRRTVEYWQRWVSRTRYRGRWREMVERSLLTLKLLTYAPTGAVIAAPTCSLPEGLGGPRNWDYRYTWLRDAAYTTYAFLRMGHFEEARNFMCWLEDRIHELDPEGSLQPLYTVTGSHHIPEFVLEHLEGYEGSRPVRIGNHAHQQLQLDAYGALLDAVYLYNKHASPISYDLWQDVRRMLNWVCDHWHEPDEGIWEVRGGRQHFVFSKMMCWVALDRGIRLADARAFPYDRGRWLANRDAIFEQVMHQGWDDQRKTFVQHYGARQLDASVLLMPLVFFVSPRDPRILSTIDAIRRELASDSLVHRYDPRVFDDGLHGIEGSFSVCTFWLVEALARGGEVDEARYVFERMLGYANHLGLYAEEVGDTGRALGNFPQAFTHLGLITAAFNLDRALDGRLRETTWSGRLA